MLQMVIFMMSLLLVILPCIEQIRAEARINCESMKNANVTLSVTVTVSNSKLELTCSSSGTTLMKNQYLKWTEMGKELPDTFITSSSSTWLNATMNNPTLFDYGVYTCRCYNNFSVAEIEEVYYSNLQYQHHCSEPVSITAAIPTDLTMKVSNHIMNIKRTTVEINCLNGTNLLYDARNSSTGSLELPFSIIVSSPHQQGKYVCTDHNSEQLREIHYIMIQDYEPPVFLIPSMYMSGTTEISASDGRVPVCVVYSSVPVSSMSYFVDIVGTQALLFGPNPIHYSTGLYLFDYGGSFINDIATYPKTCNVETNWESIEITYKIKANEKPVEPTVCLWASVDPPVNEISSGESFTVQCSLYSIWDLTNGMIKLLHIDTYGNESNLALNESEEPHHDFYHYHSTVDQATIEDAGQYICMFNLGNVGKNFSVEISILTSDISKVDEIATSETSKIVPLIMYQTGTHSRFTAVEQQTSSQDYRSSIFAPKTSTAAKSSTSSHTDNSLTIIYSVSGVTLLVVAVSVSVLILLICFMKKGKKLTIKRAIIDENIYITMPNITNSTQAQV